jgi:hypothetical protein
VLRAGGQRVSAACWGHGLQGLAAHCQTPPAAVSAAAAGCVCWPAACCCQRQRHHLQVACEVSKMQETMQQATTQLFSSKPKRR